MAEASLALELLDGQRFDVAVIGGGINGVAIARECAQAGQRTLLVERRDFGSGATSRSTRIIHGGLRYLEHGELGLVRESLRERERLLRESPHLVRPTSFLLALRPGGKRSALAVRAGLWLYRGMSGLYRRRETDVNEHMQRLERLLDQGKQVSLFHYEDAQCEFPERLVAEWLCDALAAGAVARNHTEVVHIETGGGQVRGLRLREAFSGDEARIACRWIINATGPWADAVCERSGIASHRRLIGGLRGSHLILPAFPGAPRSPVYTEACDGRPIFLIPWNGQLLLGTTEVRDEGDPERSDPSPQEVAYLFDSARALFPGAGLAWTDVRSAFAGVRPLPYEPQRSPSAVTRRHILHDHAGEGAAGMISIIGGKLTTAVAVARDCARRLGIRGSDSALPALVSAEDLETRLAEWARQAAHLGQIPEASARCIAEWHGRRALTITRLAGMDERLRAPLCEHTSHLVAEAVAAVRWECAQTLADVLLRRVPVALAECWSAECTRTAAHRLGAVLEWSAARIQQQAAAFEEERSRFLQKPSFPSQQRCSA